MASFGADMKVIQNLCAFCVEVFCQTNQWCQINLSNIYKLTILMLLQNQGHILNAFWFRKNNSSQKIKKHLSVSYKALVASFQMSELIAWQKKAHTIGEELILSA
jgi:hypothetical protein